MQTNQAQDKEAEAAVPHIQYSELAIESNALAAGSFESVYKARWEMIMMPFNCSYRNKKQEMT